MTRIASAITHDPCVCVQSLLRTSRVTQREKTQSQDGSVCEIAHTLTDSFERVSSSSVASQSASTLAGATGQSASRVLALCWVIDNA